METCLFPAVQLVILSEAKNLKGKDGLKFYRMFEILRSQAPSG